MLGRRILYRWATRKAAHTHTHTHTHTLMHIYFPPPHLPDQGLNPCSLHWKCRILTTGPQRSSLKYTHYMYTHTHAFIRQVPTSVKLFNHLDVCLGTGTLHFQLEPLTGKNQPHSRITVTSQTAPQSVQGFCWDLVSIWTWMKWWWVNDIHLQRSFSRPVRTHAPMLSHKHTHTHPHK